VPGFIAILHKDLRLELRGGESTIALVALSLLILVVLVFALNPAGGVRDADTAAGALWVALIFAGMLGATRALLSERDNGCIRGLLISPVDRATLYCATLLAAISGRVRAGDLLLPLLAVPMFVPALIAGVKASASALAGAPLADFAMWLKILIAFDVLFLSAGYLLFEHVVGED